MINEVVSNEEKINELRMTIQDTDVNDSTAQNPSVNVNISLSRFRFLSWKLPSDLLLQSNLKQIDEYNLKNSLWNWVNPVYQNLIVFGLKGDYLPLLCTSKTLVLLV